MDTDLQGCSLDNQVKDSIGDNTNKDDKQDDDFFENAKLPNESINILEHQERQKQHGNTDHDNKTNDTGDNKDDLRSSSVAIHETNVNNGDIDTCNQKEQVAENGPEENDKANTETDAEHNDAKELSNVLGEEHNGSKGPSTVLGETRMPNQSEQPLTEDKEEEHETNGTRACETENKETGTGHKEEIGDRQEQIEENKRRHQTEASTKSPDDKDNGRHGEQDTVETKEAEVAKPPSPSNANEDPDDKTQEGDDKLNKPKDMREQSSSSGMISNTIENQRGNVHQVEQGADQLENTENVTVVTPDTNGTDKVHSSRNVQLGDTGEEHVNKPREQMDSDIDKTIGTSSVPPDTIKVVASIKMETNRYVDVTNKDQADKDHDEKTVERSDEKRKINIDRQMEGPNEAEAFKVTEPNDFGQAARYQSRRGEEREAEEEALTKDTQEHDTENKASTDNMLRKEALTQEANDFGQAAKYQSKREEREAEGEALTKDTQEHGTEYNATDNTIRKEAVNQEANDFGQAARYQSKREEREAEGEALTKDTQEHDTENNSSDNTFRNAAKNQGRTDDERRDKETEVQFTLDRDAPELDKIRVNETLPRESPEKDVEEVFITSSREDKGPNQDIKPKPVEETEAQIPDTESKMQNTHSISPPLIDINTNPVELNQKSPPGVKCTHADSESKAWVENKENVVENVDTKKLDNEAILNTYNKAPGSNDAAVSNKQDQGDSVYTTGASEHHNSYSPLANKIDSTNIEPSTEQITGHSEDETIIKDTSRRFEQSNSMYFTGRLPTLEPSRTITPKIDKENEEHDQDNDNKEEINESKATSKVNEMGTNTGSNNVKAPFDKDENDEKEETTESKEDSTNRISTPSREIQKLIQEINAPAQIYTLSKEKPLTPRDKFKSNTELSNLQEQPEDSENTSSNEGDKQLTVGELNTATSKIMFDDFEKRTAVKYDELPHMKSILQYTVDNRLREPEQSNTTLQNDEESPAPITRTVTETTVDTNKKDKTMESHPDDKTPTNYEIEQTAMANQHENLANKRSNSESDLKEMIASAKRAIEDDETAIETTTEGASGYSSKGHSTTSGAWKTDESTHGSNYDGLICSKCLRLDADFVNSGFCHDCQEYLCGDCRKLHRESAATMHHYVMESYCTNELKAKKYIRATSYCRDCEIFLCGKCTVQHSGFRAFRRHKLIQSSFISRPMRPPASSESSVSLDETTENSEAEEYERARNSEQNRQRKRKKYVFEKQLNSPYGSKFDNVSESLYPGKNKILAISYTSNPQWPYSSIPALPYLVKQGSLQQRALKTPYLQAYRTPFYTKTKKTVNPNVVKLKALQSRYNLHPEKKSSRRREAGLFTARPLKNTEGVSLPDISSIRSMNIDGRLSQYGQDFRKKTEKAQSIQASNKLKTAEFIRDECLSIPFPSDELPCLIGGMEVLFDGRLVVLDKRNNNIKLFSRKFNCKASLQFQNRIVDCCASSIYPTDIYLATPKNLFEISAQKGLEVSRKMKVEIKRIEGLVCWKYGVAIVSMKSDLSWEIRLLDFRGNLKSKLEILNPFTCEIERSNRYHVVASRGGKYLTLSDVKNACAICVDVTTRCVVSETLMLDNKKPSYLAADHQNNVYVSCGDEVQQVSARGRNLGVVVRLERDRVGRVGCIAYNAAKEQLYVQMKSDVIAIYKMRV